MPSAVGLLAASAMAVVAGAARAGFPHAGCLDLVADCDASGTGHGDDTHAFEHCVATANTAGSGCINVPAGTYPTTGFGIGVPNVHFFFDAGATMTTPTGFEGSAMLISIGSGKGIDPESGPGQAHNVSILGVGGQFTMDCTRQGVTGQRVAPIRLDGNVQDFVIGNIRTKMAYFAANESVAALGLNTNALAMGQVYEHRPTNGHVFNITNTGSWGGYALVQIQSAESILFEHLDSTGGVTLRMETGVQLPGSFVGNITGRHIIGRDCSSGFMANPHAQQNGDFFIYDVQTFNCFNGIDLVPGYIQAEKGGRKLNDTVPGAYGNNSLVHGVVATYGKSGAQCDDQCMLNKLFGSSCSACAKSENKAHTNGFLGYDVDVHGVTGVGFPFKHDYTSCMAFDRHTEDCAWWPSPDDEQQ
jgi:hypothetical protein